MIKISKKNLGVAQNLHNAGWKASEIERIATAYWFTDGERHRSDRPCWIWKKGKDDGN